METVHPRRVLITTWLALAVLLAMLISSGCGAVNETGTAPSTTALGKTADSGSTFKFIVCGDPQNQYEVFDKVLTAAKSVDFLIIAGDLTGSGTATEFENFKAHMAASGVKYYAVPGNHDVATMPVDVGFKQYIGPPHRSFDYKNTHFLLIDNSTPTLGFYPAEQQWAASDLSAARSRGAEHIIAVCHVPPRLPYSANASSGQSKGIDANEMLAPVLRKGGAQELFCGHLHTYEQEVEDGLKITISGGAGAPLHGIGSYHNYILVEINGRRLDQNVVRI